MVKLLGNRRTTDEEKIGVMELRRLYRVFMWQKITATRIQKETDELLNAGFVDNFYVVLIQDKQQPLKHKLIVANDGTITTVTINAIKNNTGYLIFNIKELEKIPVKCLKKMNNNGLFMTDRKRTDYKPYTSIHRLSYCISDNCKGYEIHHINKQINNNKRRNLVKVTSTINKQFEEVWLKDETMKMIVEGHKLNWEQVEKKMNIKRYLTNNDRLELEIVKYSINHTTKETIKQFKKVIKTPQKIREIINFYYYKDEFIKWLEANKGKGTILGYVISGLLNG